MLIPRYWAEARLQERRQGKQATIRRFGWSSQSQQEAEAMAQARASEAIERAFAGEKFRRREPKVEYGGALGLPIREEIVAEVGTSVLTRNGYGAICLNSPNVLFVDIDFADRLGWRLTAASFLVLLLCAVAAAPVIGLRWYFFGPMTAVLGSWPLATGINRLRVWWGGGHERIACRRIERFLDTRQDWRVRLYRTPAGIRVLALHRLFDPEEADVSECSRAFRADPMYRLLCLNQKCFRARLTPKPWRIGMTRRLKPRHGPGVWPIASEHLPGRLAWIAEYEEKSQGFAACRCLGEMGMGSVHPEALTVQRLHDEWCRAEADLPIA